MRTMRVGHNLIMAKDTSLIIGLTKVRITLLHAVVYTIHAAMSSFTLYIVSSQGSNRFLFH